jgi:proteasome lid subunit RPN8/RPN11
MSGSFQLQIPRPLYEAMIAQAVSEQPNECCGLLAGTIKDGVGVVVERYPLVNAAANPRLFASEPRSMFAAVRDMNNRGLEILVVYHSHPTSAPIPSRTDLERNFSPDVVNLIVSLHGTQPEVCAWWLSDEDFRPAEWEVVD